ncbi:MAG: type 1 glutamine amidotransferase [Desulfuromonadaceae bacterium]|jgi:GMP synthase-like glutamine amidotransferase
MRIHALQHVSYEFLTTVEQWAKDKKHAFSKTLLYQDVELPRFDEFDLLIILGGPMSIHEEDRYPWLTVEKRFIAGAIENGRLVLGVCFGAQLLADALGARVYKNRYPEIGWHPVSLTEAAKGSRVFSRLPKTFTPFLWHEYTFDIPKGCKRVAESEGCANQAFACEDRLIGVQFHIEPSTESIQRVITCCGDKIGSGRYVQSLAEILNDKSNLEELSSVMILLMEGIERIYRKG